MKILITADIHLKSRVESPERYNALARILEQATEQRIENMIIAGDLFDQESHNYSEFEQLCANYRSIQLHIIPGNHDSGISKKIIVGPNIHIYSETTVFSMGPVTLLFIPFIHGSSMAEQLSLKKTELDKGEWLLIGHGDYFGNLRILNTYETGTYMPLSKRNIQEYGPERVFIGHIHKPTEIDNVVYYPGSPCGLDITETGVRRILIYDAVDHKVTSNRVKSDQIYFDERFFIFPHDKECTILQDEIIRRIRGWNIDDADKPKVIVRVEANGYAKDRSAVLQTLINGFAAYKFHQDQNPSIDDLSHSIDEQLNAIAARVLDSIDAIQWNYGGDEPDKEMVKLKALKSIYEAVK